MQFKTWIAAAAISSIGFAAFAHSGASGVVKKRMDAMGEMGKAMKTLTPMMQGQTDYEPDVVRSAAETILGHAGAEMTSQFPEGSNGKPSEALDVIWKDWMTFEALADALQVRAEGLKLAADNGLAQPGAGLGVEGTMSGQAMMGSGHAMMGGSQGMMGGSQGMMGVSTGQMMSAEMLAEMPANAAFMAVTQVCSACHQKFRAEED